MRIQVTFLLVIVSLFIMAEGFKVIQDEGQFGKNNKRDKTGFYTTRFGKRDPDFTRFGRNAQEDALNRIFLVRPTKRSDNTNEELHENAMSCTNLYEEDLGKHSILLCYHQ